MNSDTDRINWMEKWLAEEHDDFIYLQKLEHGMMLDTFHTTSLTRPGEVSHLYGIRKVHPVPLKP